jgi:hypothetical protein
MLYDEICKYIKPGEELNIENVYKIPYLKMILKEALRFHNIVPAMSRVLKEDLILDARGDSKKNSLHDATPGGYVFWKKIYKKVRK